ncbi:MAG: trypsin-like serine protease, partial [Paracoccaceae bacterium]
MKLRSTPGTVRVGPLRPKGPHEINLTHHILALMILLVTPCVQAEEVAMLPQLSAGERANWQAVGLLSKTGSQSGKGCTATLIAPDKVLTAAHCVANRAGYSGPAEELQFKAGQNGTKVAATRYGKRVAVHPIYGITKGVEKAAYDVAIVWLNRPIGADVAAPLPLSTQLDAGPP